MFWAPKKADPFYLEPIEPMEILEHQKEKIW